MAVTKIYKGDVERSDIQKIYKGTTLLYEKVAPQGETWVINENPVFTQLFTYSVNFESNNNQYSTFACPSLGRPDILTYDGDIAYAGSWSGQEYRTVTFETAPTGDLLTWLQNNAVKQ